MTADKRAAKVDMLEVVFFRLEVGDLANVVSIVRLVDAEESSDEEKTYDTA